MKKQIDGEILLVTILVLVFTGILLYCAKSLSSDGQTFQVISSVLTGLVGSLLRALKSTGPADPGQDIAAAGGSMETTTTVQIPKPSISDDNERKG